MAGHLGGKTTIGRLRHRVEIQVPSETLSDFRQPVQGWATDATAWARVEPLKGDEVMQGDKVQAGVTHKVTMRHRTDLTAKKRLRWAGSAGTLVLNIVAVLPMVGDANWIEVWCKREA